MKNTVYDTPWFNGVVSGSGLQADTVQLLRDRWDSFSDQEVCEHFDRGYSVFLEKLESLKNSDHAPTVYEEKELMLMLDSLLYAKSLLHRNK